MLLKVIRHFRPCIVNIINLELTKFVSNLNLFLDLDQMFSLDWTNKEFAEIWRNLVSEKLKIRLEEVWESLFQCT